MIKFVESLINLIKFLNTDNKKKEFVFYSESKFYREDFIDLILNLKKAGQRNLILITSDKEDEMFFKEILTCFYIENYFVLSSFFKNLNCKFMIMTLTDLGNHFQKSKLCKFYVYFFHAIASTHQAYTNSAFQKYDIVMSNGEYQTKELKLVEEQLNFPKKEIINSGYFFLDNIKKKADINCKEKRHILLAPSWNYSKKNLFDDYGINLIENLLSNNFILTFRPHPEHYKRSVNTMKKIDKLFSGKKNFFLDKNFSNLNSLEKAEILITDNSAIVFEFMFIFKRPIIYVDYKEKNHNINRDKISIDTIEDKFKKKFGNKIDIKNLENLATLCENLINNNMISSQLVDSFVNEHLSNLDNSALFACNYLINKSKAN
tara:strand:- start:99 stop:1223 length:1125 start_codon:yes stop_codon:yes gene_type:complete